MLSDFPPAVQAEVRRILDREARRLVEDHEMFVVARSRSRTDATAWFALPHSRAATSVLLSASVRSLGRRSSHGTSHDCSRPSRGTVNQTSRQQ